METQTQLSESSTQIRVRQYKHHENSVGSNLMTIQITTKYRYCMMQKEKIETFCRVSIEEAYKKAQIKFPYERLRLYGAAIKEIKKRARSFEDKIAVKLSGYGKVNRLVKTKRGIADIIFERKNKKAIIEIKDYKAKDISISQIKQLNKYLEDCDCNFGFLICNKKPKKSKFLIGKDKILISEESELGKIPKLIGAVG